MGEDKFICVRCFEIIGEYSAAACTRSGDFLEQVIITISLTLLKYLELLLELCNAFFLWNVFGHFFVFLFTLLITMNTFKAPCTFIGTLLCFFLHF